MREMHHPVIRLGYVGIRGDVPRWKTFGADIFGLQPVSRGEGLLFRADQRAWRIAVVQDDAPGLDYIGLEIDTHASFDALAGRLIANGYPAAESDELAKQRDVHRLLRTRAPDGTTIEFFVGALTVSEPFVSPLGATFVTGEAGLGHALFMVPDIDAALAFYMDVVGLRRSDTIEVVPGSDGHFLNGGKRHHIIALAQIPGVSGLDHFYLEVDSSSTVGRAWDKVSAGAAPVARSIGQHANDPALSFYTVTPSGFLFEYGFGSLTLVDPDRWVETRWSSPYLWGGTFGSHSVA